MWPMPREPAPSPSGSGRRWPPSPPGGRARARPTWPPATRWPRPGWSGGGCPPPGGGAARPPLRTPGHSADHCCFQLAADRAVFTGDHVLGRGTTVVEWPGGDMADYLASLELLLGIEPERLYPGHGPLVPDAVARVEGYLAHRRDREAQGPAALAAGGRARLYAEGDPALPPAAELSVRAHLVKLAHEGRVASDPAGERFTPAPA